ncbi:MAG: amino acid ABC transporter permease [Kiritimatiellae bacterium]|nr:amino acid ABC transporter permease [Kiritimatiellia bacterium]MBQ6923596.1 amino acid ABC transporter permease [Kiritimatiellia bacterium]
MKAFGATANPSRLENLELKVARVDDPGDRLRISLPIVRGPLAAFENNFYVCFVKKIPFGTREVRGPDGTVRTEQVYKGRWHYITNGLRNTLTVALCAVCLGAVLGFLVAIVRATHDKHGRLVLLNALAKVYITVIRGTPMTVQLLIAYFIIFSDINNKVLVAILAFGFNSGAYVAEIIRAGITSIDDGQMEAARSLGLSYGQGMRRIVLPQAIRNILPALGNEFIVMLKDTSIASFIGLDDLARGGSIIRSQTYQAYIPFLAVAAIYLVLVMIFSKLLTRLERHLRRTGAK